MSKELEALSRLGIDHSQSYRGKGFSIIKDYKLVKKSLQALEIVKNNKVNAWILAICNDVGAYNASIPNDMMKKLTLEEFDLLKEVLL